MPYNSSLDYTITPVQEAAIVADLENSKNGLAAIANVHIDPNSANELQTIRNTRLPYVQRAVSEFAGQYPALVSARINSARAADLFQAHVALRALETRLKEYADRVKDLSFNTENLLYLFTKDMYANAQRYEGDLDGADVVEDYLKELFEGQGPQNPTPTP